MTCEVTYKDHDYNSYSGDIVIPSTVTYEEKTYSVTRIGESAFGYCTMLKSVTIPVSVTLIGEAAFWYCSSLTSVEIPGSVTSIGNDAFRGCRSLISVTVPNSVAEIGEHAFSYCSSMTSVEIGNSVKSIGMSTFEYCTELVSVKIGNSVAEIGEYAFSYCSSLTSVKIGNTVTSIGNWAFGYCSSLTEIVSLTVTPPSIYEETFKGVLKDEAVVKVLDESVEAYKTTDYWKDFYNIIALTDEELNALGISTPSSNNFSTSGKAYNPSGAEANDSYRGIVIKNGKKFVRK